MSSNKRVLGHPKTNQPVLFNGKGSIVFSKNVTVGYKLSPSLYNGYAYIDCRNEAGSIFFGEDVFINNNFVAISEGEGIEIGARTLIGMNCDIYDSDFHDLRPDFRRGGNKQTAKVKIGENVFIGSNVKVLKGVEIGDNSVIANGSIVVKSIPENVVAAGIPAKVIKKL